LFDLEHYNKSGSNLQRVPRGHFTRRFQARNFSVRI
jgi:hypothetical protein